MPVTRLLGILWGLAIGLSACSFLPEADASCPPVDPGGDCFVPSRDAFATHALTSATAWPQLNGVALDTGDLIEGFDEVAGQRTWIVPLWARGEVVAASRFLPLGNRVRLAEVVLYQPARRTFPGPVGGQRLILVAAGANDCGDPLPNQCLFINYRWRFDSAP